MSRPCSCCDSARYASALCRTCDRYASLMAETSALLFFCKTARSFSSKRQSLVSRLT
ncbi:hypothetical protein [Undibacterium sp.]|uniref:YfgJ family double zinc ribbon protein n=1 Tax=Undibacterium sp. TaxID=1914977 RepID=UPI00345B8B23